MEKIKRIIINSLESEKGKDILIVVIVILVGLGSFELGRLSKENISSGIKILSTKEETGLISSENLLQTTNKITPTISNSVDKNFFASNKGTKYYSIGCSAGKTLKQENRIYFTTKEEAETAGYTLSSSCR